ncbi:MAG: hypothetical protein LBB81_07055 [Treponema sp.]|jgi:hypothetical protein|nr:hypothetical protein [Treponema sp.]
MKKNTLFITGIIISVFLFFSCSSLQAGLYLSSVDKVDGDQILVNEKNAKGFLENVLNAPDKYIITAYERCGINYQIKRTKLLTHSYYVFTEPIAGEYHTLSFYGTKIAFYSKGAWSMDADSDMSSYNSYLDGNNKWDVVQIDVRNGVDTTETVKNILGKMDREIIYYYRNHIKKKPGKDNCNTALWETVAER